MDDRQWLQTWQAVCQKEAEMKIRQQQSVEKFRILEMKMRLMDLRVDTAFKIRDEYLNKLINKYPNWKPAFVSVGPKNSFVQSTPRNKTELAIAQLVDMDMLQNWDEKITLEHLVQSKFKNTPTLNSSSPLRDDSIKDIKIELEQVKKQLNEISLYMRDMKSVQISEQQPRTTVSISRRPSMRDREYSATEHIRLPRAPDSAHSFDEAEKEDDSYYDKPKPAAPTVVARPAVVQKAPEPRQPPEPVTQRQPAEPAAPVSTGPRFNFGATKEPAATIIEPAKPVTTALPSPAKEPPAVIIEQTPEPKLEQKVSKPVPPVQPAQPKRDPFVVEPEPLNEPKKSTSFFTDPIKDDLHSSTPESTPEVAKSTKVVKSYEALLGIVKEKSSDTLKKTDSDSDSSSDDIEKRMKSPPPPVVPKISLAVDSALGRKIDSQAQIATGQPSSTAKQSSSSFLLDTFTKSEDKKTTTPSNTQLSSSSLLPSTAPIETKSSPAKAALAQKQEPMSDPDDFLAKLFPDKFGTKKKADEKPKGGPAASLFGERKPNKSAFFIGDDSDSETVDIPKKKQSADDDFDFFS